MSGVALNIGSLSRYGGRINSLSRTIISAAAQAAWSPLSLFQSGEQGAWYDPTDLTRYMDVSASPELVTNGRFDANASSWFVKTGSVAWSSGTANVNGQMYQDLVTEVGKTYLMEYDAAPRTAGGTWYAVVYTHPGAGGAPMPNIPNGTGSVTRARYVFTATTVHHSVSLQDGIFDNISVREVPLISQATMYQDAAGITPVTAVEQPVGLILDRRLGAMGALGADIVTNGDFSSGTGWNLGTGYSIGSGALNIASAAYSEAWQASSVVSGRSYLVRFDITSYTSGVISFALGGGSAVTLSAGAGAKQAVCVAGANGRITFIVGSATMSVDNLSVREIPGNHATQATSASRPILRNRYNLLTRTEQLDNAAWEKHASASATARQVTFASDVDSRVIQGFSSTSGTITATVVFSDADVGKVVTFAIWSSGLNGISSGRSPNLTVPAGGVVSFSWSGVTNATIFGILNATTGGAQSLTLRDGSGVSLVTAIDAALPYQRVAAATDYDSDPTKFPLYLAFDGADDSLATGAINFTGTDKMTFFAGICRIGATGSGIIVETSPDFSVNSGSFALFEQSGAVNIQLYANGTAGQTVNIDGGNPRKSLYTGTIDIGAPLLRLRENAGAWAQNSASLGSGSFGNYALFIGRRNNAALAFNGRLHQLIIRGAATPDLSQAESFVAARTGVTL